jgi:hypothetical protein
MAEWPNIVVIAGWMMRFDNWKVFYSFLGYFVYSVWVVWWLKGKCS